MTRRIIGATALGVIGLALAGCSSSSGSSTTTTTSSSGSSTPGATGSTGTTATTGSTPASTGSASAKDVGTAYITLSTGSDPTAFCKYAVPDQVSACQTDLTPSGTPLKFNNMALGTVDVQGSQAVINITGSFCQGGQCQSNSDPNVATSGGTSFSDAFAAANDPNSQDGSPFVIAAVLQNGAWYASGF